MGDNLGKLTFMTGWEYPWNDEHDVENRLRAYFGKARRIFNLFESSQSLFEELNRIGLV